MRVDGAVAFEVDTLIGDGSLSDDDEAASIASRNSWSTVPLVRRQLGRRRSRRTRARRSLSAAGRGRRVVEPRGVLPVTRL
jgi:hypothetical protein